MNKQELLDFLKKFIEENSLVKAADALGHTNTMKIYRWINKGSIPDSQVEMVQAILEKKGLIK